MRIQNIDFLKVFSIFIVIIIHFDFDFIKENLNTPFMWTFHNFLSIGVILFIIITGYLIIDKEYSYKSILLKIASLVVLIFIYKMIYYAVMGEEWNYKVILGGLFDYNDKVEFGDYRTNHLWYIYMYIGILIIQPVFRVLYSNKKTFTQFTILLAIISFAFTYIYNQIDIFSFVDSGIARRINPLSSSMYSLYLCGGLIKMNSEKIENFLLSNKRKYIIMLSSIFIITLILSSVTTYYLVYYLDFKMNTNTEHYGSIFGLIMGLSFFILFRFLVPRIDNEPIRFISKNVLGFYFLHWPIAYLVKKHMFEYDMFRNFGGTILTSVISLLICYIIALILNKNKFSRKLLSI